MKLLSLGISSIPAPARPALEAATQPDLREHGTTGTPISSGFLRDSGEYNPEMTGTAAFATFEKMRRSDAQVAATLLAMKLPIEAAEWTVNEPKNASRIEREAAAFIRQCLLEELDWQAVIGNALLMLDFGCACHEDVYHIDGNRVKVSKLAPRLPSTFYRWITAPGTEDLAGIEQSGELPGGGWGTVTVPLSKAALFTFQAEGNNWAGRSVMRPMYQHWYIKAQLYKIDAIAQERNGMGFPTFMLPQDASKEDKALALKWVQQICAHEKAGVSLPFGSTFKMEGVTGTVQNPQASIAHHNAMISVAGLAMFLQFGHSSSGNRALGESMTDFFGMAMQSTANHIARVIRLSTIKRLVEWNFGPAVRPPMLTAQNLMAIKLETVVNALQQLSASGFVTPDDGLEQWLRGKMGLPESGRKGGMLRA